MRVLFNCEVPSCFAHGGMQIQVEHSAQALKNQGVDVQYLRWWDEEQTAEILHNFGALSESTIRLAQNRGLAVVMTVLLSQTCNRSPFELWLRKLQIRGISVLPKWQGLGQHPLLDSCRACNQILVGLEAERKVITKVYGIPESNVSVVPLGSNSPFSSVPREQPTEDHLITVGTIAPVKQSVELALLARKAKVPILFVGKPFDPRADYWHNFAQLIDGKYVRHLHHVSSQPKLIEIYKKARGFVLFSAYENWSLASHEAAACGLPLMLPDLPWSRERFGNKVKYFPKNRANAAVALEQFYHDSELLSAPEIAIPSWSEVGIKLKTIYESTLARCATLSPVSK